MNINILEYQNNLEKKINRILTINEKEIIENAFDEEDRNKSIDIINSNLNLRNLTITNLTNYLNNDSLFQSLIYLNFGNQINNLKISISYLMYIFKDYKNFAYNNSLSEIFNLLYESDNSNYNYNYIVKSNKDKKYYKYDYKIMCLNIMNNTLNYHNDIKLILIFISRFFNIKIKLIYENNFEYNIELCDDVPNNSITLCVIGNTHILPVKEKNEKKNVLYYNKYKNQLNNIFNI